MIEGKKCRTEVKRTWCSFLSHMKELLGVGTQTQAQTGSMTKKPKLVYYFKALRFALYLAGALQLKWQAADPSLLGNPIPSPLKSPSVPSIRMKTIQYEPFYFPRTHKKLLGLSYSPESCSSQAARYTH